jgi:transglutaminase-like putative cysteine protease
MRQCCSIVAIVCLGSIASRDRCSAAEQEFVLESKQAQTIRAVYSFEIHLPELTAKEWIVFAAQAPTSARQRDVQTRLLPGGEPYRDLSPRNRALLRSRLPATTDALRHTARAEIEYRATLYSRHLVRLRRGEEPPVVKPPPVAEREASLAETSTLDFTAKPFQAWLQEQRLHRRKRESELDFGRRVFLAVTRSLEYDYAARMDRKASHLCEAERTDCGGMCVLFCSALRANGIPARMLCGRWAKSSKPDATLNGVAYNQQHVKAEFFVADLGWVPVDPSSAVLHDKTPEGLQYFGHDRGDFFVVHLDPDFEVDTVHFGRKSFIFLQGFHYYVTGSGKLDGETLKLKWTVESSP